MTRAAPLFSSAQRGRQQPKLPRTSGLSYCPADVGHRSDQTMVWWRCARHPQAGTPVLLFSARFRHRDSDPVSPPIGTLSTMTGWKACRSLSLIGWPSRPGEFHPQPLTEPDVSLSTYPARATHRRLPPSAATSGFILDFPVDPIGHDASDPLPSLHGHYPASSLLRSSPPLLDASVLSASRDRRLCLLPYHHPAGSQVPYHSPD